MLLQVVSLLVSAADFFAASNVLIVAGKGGVGKSTVGATIGVAAAKAGYDVLVVELEGYSSLGALLGVDSLGYEETTVTSPALVGAGKLRARQIMADTALNEYLDGSIVGPVAKALGSSGAVEVVATAAPGIRDLLAMGKIRQIEQANTADLVVVDAPASGHALTFLAAPAAMAESTNSGPLKEQADLALQMMTDETRCQVMLVTLPEETPVNETIETAFNLEDTVDLKLGPIIVNGVWPELPGLSEAIDSAEMDAKANKQKLTAESIEAHAAGRYRLERIASQRSEMQRLEQELPLPQIHLPFLFTTELADHHLDQLAEHMIDQANALSARPGQT